MSCKETKSHIWLQEGGVRGTTEQAVFPRKNWGCISLPLPVCCLFVCVCVTIHLLSESFLRAIGWFTIVDSNLRVTWEFFESFLRAIEGFTMVDSYLRVTWEFFESFLGATQGFTMVDSYLRVAWELFERYFNLTEVIRTPVDVILMHCILFSSILLWFQETVCLAVFAPVHLVCLGGLVWHKFFKSNLKLYIFLLKTCITIVYFV